MFQLAQHDGVTEVNIRRGGIDTEIHAQRLAGLHGILELGLEVGLRNDFGDTFFQVGKLFVHRFERSRLGCWRLGCWRCGLGHGFYFSLRITRRPVILNWPASTSLTASV